MDAFGFATNDHEEDAMLFNCVDLVERNVSEKTAKNVITTPVTSTTRPIAPPVSTRVTIMPTKPTATIISPTPPPTPAPVIINSAKLEKLESYEYRGRYISENEVMRAIEPIRKQYDELSSEQKEVFMYAMKGNNVFYTGSAGTGKSHLFRLIMQGLRLKYGSGGYKGSGVYVTGPTGSSAHNVRGMTINSYCGIGLDDKSLDALFFSVFNNKKAKERILETRTLMIDEASMISSELFTRVNYVMKRIRNKPEHPFGGVQVIMTGDMFQLPPVINVAKNTNTLDFNRKIIDREKDEDILFRIRGLDPVEERKKIEELILIDDDDDDYDDNIDEKERWVGNSSETITTKSTAPVLGGNTFQFSTEEPIGIDHFKKNGNTIGVVHTTTNQPRKRRSTKHRIVEKFFRSDFCFDSTVWKELFPPDMGLYVIGNKFVLTEVYRQKGDTEFIHLLNELRLGYLSDTNYRKLRRCVNRVYFTDNGQQQHAQAQTTPNTPQIIYTRIFPYKSRVNEINKKYYDGIPVDPEEPAIICHSIDYACDNDYLQHMDELFASPQVIEFKIGTYVMLTHNVDPSLGLYNGSKGKIVRILNRSSTYVYGNETSKLKDGSMTRVKKSLETEGQAMIEVLFDNGSCVHIEYHRSELRDDTGKNILAFRTQFPLIYAWALTIHKCQGMTVSHLSISLKDCFEAGQAFVALSRAVSLDQLNIEGKFSKDVFFANPHVLFFYWTEFPKMREHISRIIPSIQSERDIVKLIKALEVELAENGGKRKKIKVDDFSDSDSDLNNDDEDDYDPADREQWDSDQDLLFEDDGRDSDMVDEIEEQDNDNNNNNDNDILFSSNEDFDEQHDGDDVMDITVSDAFEQSYTPFSQNSVDSFLTNNNNNNDEEEQQQQHLTNDLVDDIEITDETVDLSEQCDDINHTENISDFDDDESDDSMELFDSIE